MLLCQFGIILHLAKSNCITIFGHFQFEHLQHYLSFNDTFNLEKNGALDLPSVFMETRHSVTVDECMSEKLCHQSCRSHQQLSWHRLDLSCFQGVLQRSILSTFEGTGGRSYNILTSQTSKCRMSRPPLCSVCMNSIKKKIISYKY